MSEANKFNPAWLLAIIVPIILVIAIAVYLNSSECYTTAEGVKHCLTGYEALQLEWPAFWYFAIGGFLAAGFFGYLAVRNENKGSGSTGVTVFLVIIAIACLCGPWGKGCTDKANGGITAPGYQHVDSTQSK